MGEVERRWEQCVPHDARSERLAGALAQIDAENDDEFDWKFGGDGDNGEALLFLLDIYFATNTEQQTITDFLDRAEARWRELNKLSRWTSPSLAWLREFAAKEER